MDDNFKLRVDKVFGSLLQSRTGSSEFSRSLPWSVSDGEVEHRKWRRERDSPDRDDLPCASVDGFFSDDKRREPKDLTNELEDLHDLDDEGQGSGGDLLDAEKEEREIRNSIGLDVTLDNEDEEDEYDKVATGREDTGDRLYMRDVYDSRSYFDCDTISDDLFEDSKNFGRDPRADHLAARARLKEDAETTATVDVPGSLAKKIPDVVELQEKPIENGDSVKSILKRKETQMESKPKKRVRFDPECKEQNLGDGDDHDLSKVNESMESTSVAEMNDMSGVALEGSDYGQHVSYVPDYLRNPQNYTCYTLDSTDEADDESNKQALRDLCSMMKKSSSSLPESESLAGPPTSITFTPRKKVNDPTATSDGSGMEDSSSRVMCPVRIAVTEQQESEACAMDEDDPASSVNLSTQKKPSRQYRSKVYSAD